MIYMTVPTAKHPEGETYLELSDALAAADLVSQGGMRCSIRAGKSLAGMSEQVIFVPQQDGSVDVSFAGNDLVMTKPAGKAIQ